jgi:hypothetical protein
MPRRRRFGEARSAARREHLGPGLAAARARCPEWCDAAVAKVLGYLDSEGVMRRDTWPLQRVKRGPYEAETRNIACKGDSAVRRHAGGLYDAGSYCYTLVKCLKSFVRNGKGVIEANDYAQGPPINSEPLVMKRTHCNEKRAPKATANLSVFGLLSIFLFHFPVLLSVFLISIPRHSCKSSLIIASEGRESTQGLLCRRPPFGPGFRQHLPIR